jgi:hypothetical protein
MGEKAILKNLKYGSMVDLCHYIIMVSTLSRTVAENLKSFWAELLRLSFVE